MKPWRIVIIVLIVVAGILLIVTYLRPSVPLSATAVLPMDLRTVIPDAWEVIPQQFKTCDFDNDGDQEYLIIYRYDVNQETKRGLIGGAIYDSQVNRVPQAPGVEAPYRPAFMVPYKLLPDIYGGKGQGYLGQDRVVVYTLPLTAAGAPCRAREILVYGYSYDDYPTTLSIFRWEGELVGYIGWHVQGNVRLRAYAVDNSDPGKPADNDNTAIVVAGVYTYNQLNQRSLLCAVRRYRRTLPVTKDDLPPGLDFTEVKEDYTIDFCYGPPNDPVYPEGVVVALLRGQNPSGTTPTGQSYLMAEAQSTLPAELSELKKADRKPPFRILSVSAPGSLGWYPPAGSRFIWTPTGGTPAPTPQVWWINETPPTVVETEIVLNDGSGQTRRVAWTLVSMAREKANADTIWRISRVELR